MLAFFKDLRKKSSEIKVMIDELDNIMAQMNALTAKLEVAYNRCFEADVQFHLGVRYAEDFIARASNGDVEAKEIQAVLDRMRSFNDSLLKWMIKKLLLPELEKSGENCYCDPVSVVFPRSDDSYDDEIDIEVCSPITTEMNKNIDVLEANILSAQESREKLMNAVSIDERIAHATHFHSHACHYFYEYPSVDSHDSKIANEIRTMKGYLAEVVAAAKQLKKKQLDDNNSDNKLLTTDKRYKYAVDLLPSSMNDMRYLDTYLKQGEEKIFRANELIKDSDIGSDNSDYFDRVSHEASRREDKNSSEWLTPGTRIHYADFTGGRPNRRLF